MKLWDKGGLTSEAVLAFTVGNDRETDKRLAKSDIKASRAHAQMLHSCGLLTSDELEQLLEGFERLEAEVSQAGFAIPEELEDIHSFLEYRLTAWYGETGKKIHTARSRNDQVLTALHLYLKEELEIIWEKTRAFGLQLCDQAEAYDRDFIPGYTHTQVAMPSSIGMWLGGFAECLADDLLLIETVHRLADQNPLGTAAGYGSTFPINRMQTTTTLDFSKLKVNPVAAQLNRGKLEQSVSYALAQTGLTLGKLANDCIWLLNQHFRFISFPDALTTGSSIMPHKKNPDVFELVRAKAGQLSAIPNEINLLTHNLFSGYHRDFQLLKEPVFRSIDLFHAIIDIMAYMLPQMEVEQVDLSDPRYTGLFSVDAVAELVQQGYSFRDAYVAVGMNPVTGQLTPAETSHIGSLYRLGIDLIRQKLNH